MKELLIIRHGKAAPLESTDFLRPLQSRGKEDAEKLAGFLRDQCKANIPQLISAAARTRETGEIINQHLGRRMPETHEAAYLAPAQFWLEQITRWPEPLDQGLLIGHNPGMSDLVHILTGESVWLPTCGMARIKLEIDAWQEASGGLGSIISIWTPKD